MLMIPADHDLSVGRSPVIHHHEISGGHEPGVPFTTVHPAVSETRTTTALSLRVCAQPCGRWCLSAMPVRRDVGLKDLPPKYLVCCNTFQEVQNGILLACQSTAQRALAVRGC
jgi:hypothetical protein